MQVARADFNPGIGNSDDGLAQVVAGETRSAQHGPGRSAAGPFGDGVATLGMLGGVHMPLKKLRSAGQRERRAIVSLGKTLLSEYPLGKLIILVCSITMTYP